MKRIFFFILFAATSAACTRVNTVQLSGRIENGDSIVSIWVEDSIYTFPLDENNFFSGKVVLEQSGYATLLYNSLNLYLSPGENLEIYVNALNFSSSLYFRGSLGGINSYLKEQEVAVFFDKDYYTLDEEEFVRKMNDLIQEKTDLLEAKNFSSSFTVLERERIRYSVANRASFYPIYRRMQHPEQGYQPGETFNQFMCSFSLNNESLYGTKDFRSFLLNYVYLQGSRGKSTETDYSDGMVDYILSVITNPTIKNFLLTEIVYRHIWENNGVEGADYLLSVFHRECTDKNKIAYMDELIRYWERITPGNMAPGFEVRDRNGRPVTLEDFRGSYLYITVWATWCVPCKVELPCLDRLQKEYSGKNIRFLTVAIDDSVHLDVWKTFLMQNPHAGFHTFAESSNAFNKDYMIISIPRFILIDPDGRIVSSNAPRPSGKIHVVLDSLDI